MKYDQNVKGFTLIELMAVVAIIAVIAAIAYPSYRAQVIRNAEGTAKSALLDIQAQAEKWRARQLSYRGFVPKDGKGTGGSAEPGYDVPARGIIYLPHGSTAANYKYQITIVDGSDTTRPLTHANAAGISWVATAVARANTVAADGRKFLINGAGLKCFERSTVASISPALNTCTNNQTW